MAPNTKGKILETALRLFSEKGYEGTNMREIAEALGLVKSSLYKHFDSKEAIWTAIVDKMSEYYNARFGSEENLPEIPKSTDELMELTMKMVNFTIHDERIIMTRRVIMTEQFRDERARALATEHFVVGIERIFKRIFAEMMENGSIRRDDPSMLAFGFAAPISEMIHMCDREPELEKQILDRIHAFVEHFIATYGMTK